MISDDFKKKAGLTPELIAGTIRQFYANVDAASEKTMAALTAGGLELRCQRGCCSCCLDDLAVTPAEAAVIVDGHSNVLAEAPHAAGQCAFLDETGSCRIYPDRPYICRTHGLPLRWTDEDEEGEFEERDICELNQHIDLAELAQNQCFTLGLAELQLQKMNDVTYGAWERVKLRDLFKS